MVGATERNEAEDIGQGGLDLEIVGCFYYVVIEDNLYDQQLHLIHLQYFRSFP